MESVADAGGEVPPTSVGSSFRVSVEGIPQQLSRRAFYDLLQAHPGGSELCNAVLFPSFRKVGTCGVDEDVDCGHHAGFAWVDYVTRDAARAAVTAPLHCKGLGNELSMKSRWLGESKKVPTRCPCTDGWARASVSDVLSAVARASRKRERDETVGVADIACGVRSSCGSIIIG